MKRILSMTVAIILALTMAACGDTQESSSTTAGASSVSSTSSADEQGSETESSGEETQSWVLPTVVRSALCCRSPTIGTSLSEGLQLFCPTG